MLVVGVDSSARSGSVSLMEDADIVCEVRSSTPQSFSRSLISLIEELFINNRKIEDVDAFAVASGPGSFTGIRIGSSTLMGIAYSQSKPLYGVSSLEAMATAVRKDDSGIYCPLIDAGKGNVYYGLFEVGDNDSIKRISDDAICSLEELLENSKKDYLFFGDAVDNFEDTLKSKKSTIINKPFGCTIAAGVATVAQSKFRQGKMEGSSPKLNYVHQGPVRN